MGAGSETPNDERMDAVLKHLASQAPPGSAAGAAAAASSDGGQAQGDSVAPAAAVEAKRMAKPDAMVEVLKPPEQLEREIREHARRRDGVWQACKPCRQLTTYRS